MSSCLSTDFQQSSIDCCIPVSVQPSTAIFPQTYTGHESDDNFLGMMSCCKLAVRLCCIFPMVLVKDVEILWHRTIFILVCALQGFHISEGQAEKL